MGSLEQNTTLIYGIHIRESANDGSDFSNGATDYRVLFLGEDGKLHVKDSAGTVSDPFTSGSGTTVNTDRVDLTAGSITLNSTNWAEIAAATGGPGTGGLDLDFTGLTAGDVVECSMSHYLNSASTYAYFTFATIVSGSPVNYIGGRTGAGTGDGISAWVGITGREETKGGSVHYAIVSGDLDSGALKLRPYYRTSAATNRTLFGTSANPLQVSAVVYT